MTWFLFLRGTLAMMGKVAGGERDGRGEQSTLAGWRAGTPVLTPWGEDEC